MSCTYLLVLAVCLSDQHTAMIGSHLGVCVDGWRFSHCLRRQGRGAEGCLAIAMSWLQQAFTSLRSCLHSQPEKTDDTGDGGGGICRGAAPQCCFVNVLVLLLLIVLGRWTVAAGKTAPFLPLRSTVPTLFCTVPTGLLLKAKKPPLGGGVQKKSLST